MTMTPDERTEGGRALAAVIIGNGVPWATLSDAVRERYMRAYEVVAAVRDRHRMAASLAPMGHAETFTDYPGDPLFGGDGGGAETEATGDDA